MLLCNLICRYLFKIKYTYSLVERKRISVKRIWFAASIYLVEEVNTAAVFLDRNLW